MGGDYNQHNRARKKLPSHKTGDSGNSWKSKKWQRDHKLMRKQHKVNSEMCHHNGAITDSVTNVGRTGLLTHWGRVTYICVGKLTIIGSDNSLSPERHQAIIWTNAGNKLLWNFNRNWNIFIEENTFENVVCEMLFISSQPQCVKVDRA